MAVGGGGVPGLDLFSDRRNKKSLCTRWNTHGQEINNEKVQKVQ